MKTNLIIFGVFFLVLGGLLYYVPNQEFSAGTTTSGDGSTDVRTSSANILVPAGWAYASAIIGFVLLLLGLIIPGSVRTVQGPRGPRGRESVRYNRRSARRRPLRRGTTVTTTKVTRTKR